MNFNKSVVLTVFLSFLSCFLLWTYWSSAAGLVDTGFKAAQPFLLGAGIAYIVNIVMKAYEKLWQILFKQKAPKWRQSVSLLLSYLSFILLVFIIFSVVLPDLISSIKTLLTVDIDHIREVIADLQEKPWVQELLEKTGANTDLSQQIANYSQQLLNQVLNILTSMLTSATSIANTVMTVFISLIFSIYVLASKESLGRQFSLLIDTFTGKFAKTIYYLIGIFDQRFRGFFVSQSLEAVILGSLTFIGMSLLKLPYAGTISLLIAFTAIIPVVGAYIGVTIGTILILTQSVQQAIIFVIFVVLLQQFEGNLIYPRVVGESIGLPAIWVLVAITIGGAVAGILGMLVAVPVAASCYQILKDYIHKKNKTTLS
ncbi:AI-2E family transporter [Streptococcus entericus]|uniref:AI-2E family transporter n=1 Tax=Streptococcus entericus TaxID=155680 RepID=UPI00035EA4CA|nr:AI-2E family transporter [Streptococcus entericus]